MALEAFRIHVSNIGFDLPKTDQITAIEIWDSCVYVGTKAGVVHQYVRDDRTQGSSPQNTAKSNGTIALLDEIAPAPISTESYQPMSRVTVSKKPIQTIKSIPQLNLLIVLTDAKIVFHDLRTLKKCANKPEIYYVGLFTIDPTTYQLCMSVKGKRKLYFYTYNHTAEKYEYSKELFVPEVPLALTWVNSRICIGIQGNYVLINPPDGKTFPLSFMIDHLPLLTPVAQQEVCVFTSEVGIYIMSTGDPSPRPPVVFSSRPQAICALDQYLVGVSDGVLEVVSTYDSKVIQCPSLDMLIHDYPEYKLPVTEPAESFQPGGDPLAPMIASHHNNVVVYLPQQSHIVILHAVPVEIQIKQYLNKLMMDEALALLMAKSPSQREIEAFHIDAGLELIIALQFHRAFQHFAWANIEPSQLLASLFPHILTLPKHTHPSDNALFQQSLHSLVHDPTVQTNTNNISNNANNPAPKTQQNQPKSSSYSIPISHPSLQSASLLEMLKRGRGKYISHIRIEDFIDIDQVNPADFKCDKNGSPSCYPFALSYTALYSLLLWYLMLFLQQQRNQFTQALSKHQKASLLQSRQKSQGYVMSDDYFHTQQLDQHNRANILSPQKLTHHKQELTYIDNALLFLTITFTAVFNPHFHLNYHNSFNVHTFSLLEYIFPFLDADGYTPEQWYYKAQHFYDTSLDLFHYNADIMERQKQQQRVTQQQLLAVGSTTATTNASSAVNTTSSTNSRSTSTTSPATPAHPLPFALYLAQQALILLPKKTRCGLTFIQQQPRSQPHTDPSAARRKRNLDENDEEGKKTNRYHDDPNLHIATPLEGFHHLKLQAYPISQAVLSTRSPILPNPESPQEDDDGAQTSTARRRREKEKRKKNQNQDPDPDGVDETTTLGRALSEQSSPPTGSPTTTTTTTTTTTSNLCTKKYLSYFPISIQSLLSTQYCTPIYFILLLSNFEQWYGLAFWYLQRHILSQQYFYPLDLRPATYVDEIPLTHPTTLYWLDQTSPLCHALQIYYRLSITYTGPIRLSPIAAPSATHTGLSYKEFVMEKSKLIKSTIDLFEYEDTNMFIPNFYLCRRTSPPIGFMAHILRYQSSKDSSALPARMRTLTVHYNNGNDEEGGDDGNGGDGDDDEDHEDDHHDFDIIDDDDDQHHNHDTIHSSDDEHNEDGGRQLDDGIGELGLSNPTSALPNVLNFGDHDEWGLKVTPFNLSESNTQQATLFVNEISNMIYAYFPQEQHTTLTSSTYRKALGQSDDHQKGRFGAPPSTGGGYTSYLRISALKKTAKFLYNPFKRRQHWSHNATTASSRRAGNSSQSDSLRPMVKDGSSAASAESVVVHSRDKKFNSMKIITNLNSLDLYNIPNSVCPDFFNVQLAFDCYFVQQQQEYPISDILLQYYYYSYYYTPSSLLYAIQLLENQPLWELYYQFIDFHANPASTSSSTSQFKPSSQQQPQQQQPQQQPQQPQHNSQVGTPIGTSFLLGPISDFSSPSSPSSLKSAQNISNHATNRPKCLNTFPPLAVLHAYLPWITSLAPSLIIPLLSSMWLTLLVEYHSSLTKPAVPIITIENDETNTQSTQLRTVARSKAISDRTSPTELSSRAVQSKAINMTMVISPTNSPTSAATSSQSPDTPSIPPELSWLQQLSTMILDIDVQTHQTLNTPQPTPTALPFPNTNRLLNIYTSLEDLDSSGQTITSCIQSQKNHPKVVEKQNKLLSQIVHYDRLTPPLFILLLTYVLHAMNCLPIQDSLPTTPSIPMIFSLLFPPQAQTILPSDHAFATDDPSYLATSEHKMIDTLLFMLIKQLRQIEAFARQIDSLGTLSSSQLAEITPVEASSRIISNVGETSESITALDPTLYVTRLNNMLIQKNDYSTLLLLLQNSFVTTITDIIHSPTFYQEISTSAAPQSSPSSPAMSSQPSATLASQTHGQTPLPIIHHYITHSYAPSVDIILDAIRGQQQPPLALSTSSAMQPIANSLSHCCLTLEARLGHHTDVINLYMFTLEDIDGALSYIRVVNDQQNQTDAAPQKEESSPIFILFLQIAFSKQYQAHMAAKPVPAGTLVDPNNAPASWLDVIMYIFQTHGRYFVPHLHRVLTLLPSALPISTLLPLFEQNLPQLNHLLDANAIISNFAKRSYITNKLQLFTLRKGYVVLNEPTEPTQKATVGNRNRQIPTKNMAPSSPDQVCLICNKTLLEGTVVASLPFNSLLYLINHYPDIFFLNSQGQKDPALPQPTQRNGIADLYSNNIMCHYNCTQRIQKHLGIAQEHQTSKQF